MKSRTNKKMFLFYFALIAVACVSCLFTNISYDAEYQLAMAYRMIKGDEMITQMWEPHQTSAFLCAILMKVYLKITGTTTGIVLYTQAVGLLIRTGISIWLYKTIKEISGEMPAIIAGVIYLLISPKDLLTPEFSNMQLWFGTILFLLLLQYLKKMKVVYLLLAAVSLCLGVFSYPSFIIVYIAVCFVLFKYAENYKRDILIFTGVCALIGGCFAGYLLIKNGVGTILKCLHSALAVEPSHTVNIFQKALTHLGDIAGKIGLLGAAGLLSIIIDKIYCRVRKVKGQGTEGSSSDRSLLFFWYILMGYMTINILYADNRCGYAIVLLAIVGLGIWKRKLLSAEEKRMYDSASGIGCLSLLATMLLSDHPFLPAVAYMHVLICVSIVPIYHWINGMRREDNIRKGYVAGVHIFMLLIIVRCIYLHIPIYGRGQICTIFSDLALIRSGPAIGIVTDEAGAARQRDSMQEWKQYIREGDTIWILGEPVDTLGYLYENVEVGAPSVMSTPTYSEELLNYWEMNPEKYPNVIILASGFGELSYDLLKNEWLMNWIENEYCADTIIDGNYWRYYFKNKSQ